MRKKIFYKIKRSGRTRRLRLSVRSDCSVLITIPTIMDESEARKFLETKKGWILKQIEFFKSGKKLPKDVENKNDYRRKKEYARKMITERVNYFCKKYDFYFNKIFIRNQKTRWGSCSSLRNLNFNYKLIYLSEEQMNYIIVHELCHLKEMNHSKRFWKLVGEIIPDYRSIEKEVRKIAIG